MLLTKELLTDAICGAGFKDMRYADECVKLGLARWTGDQYNPNWAWRRDVLLTKGLIELQEIYERTSGTI